MFDHLLESSHQDNFNKWSNRGLGEEKAPVVSTRLKLILCILSGALKMSDFCTYIPWKLVERLEHVESMHVYDGGVDT